LKPPRYGPARSCRNGRHHGFSSSLLTAIYNYSDALAWFHCHTAANRFPTIRLGYRNNDNPGVALSEMDKSGKYSSALMAKLRMREAAHQNCLEIFGILAAAVVRPSSFQGATTWQRLKQQWAWLTGNGMGRWEHGRSVCRVDERVLAGILPLAMRIP
jgi:hypothetical protein